MFQLSLFISQLSNQNKMLYFIVIIKCGSFYEIKFIQSAFSS